MVMRGPVDPTLFTIKELDEPTPFGIGNTFDLTNEKEERDAFTHFLRAIRNAREADGSVSIEFWGMGYTFIIQPHPKEWH